MSLLETWRNLAYEQEMGRPESIRCSGQHILNYEKGVYEQILASKEPVSGTVKELADRFGLELLTMVGVLDGINDSLKTPNPIETMDENTVVSMDFDKESLYKNMVAAKAEWLYTLPQWDDLLDADTRKALYKEQKLSTTIVNTQPKVGT